MRILKRGKSSDDIASIMENGEFFVGAMYFPRKDYTSLFKGIIKGERFENILEFEIKRIK